MRRTAGVYAAADAGSRYAGRQGFAERVNGRAAHAQEALEEDGEAGAPAHADATLCATARADVMQVQRLGNSVHGLALARTQVGWEVVCA